MYILVPAYVHRSMFGSMHNHIDRERRFGVGSMESLKRLGDVLLPDVPVRSLCARHIVGFDAQLTLPGLRHLRAKLQVFCSRHRRHGGRTRLRRDRPHKCSLRQQRSGQECAGDARWDKQDARPAHALATVAAGKLCPSYLFCISLEPK